MKLKFRADFKDIISFLILCVVLLYLVAIAVLNLKSVSQDGYIWGLNPFPAFGPDYIFATLLFFAVTLAAIMASCSSYFFEREEGFGITTEKKSKADGYTKVWDAKDMKKDYGIKKIHLQDDSYSAGGFPVINDGVNAWVDDGENHSLIMGASGSGKSQSFMFPLIRILAKHGESMIVTDPKGELYEGCGNLLKEKGYRLILVNFRDPSEGSAWNPFSYPYRIYKEGNVDKANELLQDLASNILIDPNNKDGIDFLKRTSKRIRKYNGSLIVSTQNMIDFTADEIKRFGQVIVDNSAYIGVMAQGVKELEALGQMMNLSDSETNFLRTASRGEMLFVISQDTRIPISIVVRDEEKELFGNAGGR